MGNNLRRVIHRCQNSKLASLCENFPTHFSVSSVQRSSTLASKTMVCESLVLCKRPKEPVNEYILHNHQVLRVIFVPPGESREVLAGLLGISILVSMLVMFLFWSTSPVCKTQDACQEACGEPSICKTFTSPYSGMLANLLLRNSSIDADDWDKCHATAVKWLSAPGNVRFDKLAISRDIWTCLHHRTLGTCHLTSILYFQPLKDMVCYFPNPLDQNSIACIEPLQGDACDLEKKYQKMLVGASSTVILIAFLLVPRTLEFIFNLIIGMCCQSAFVRGQNKNFKGVSLGVLVLIGLAGLVFVLIANGGSGFIGLRFMVWAITWIASMLIVEPIACLISYYIIRCEPKKKIVSEADEESAGESKPLISHDIEQPRSLKEIPNQKSQPSSELGENTQTQNSNPLSAATSSSEALHTSQEHQEPQVPLESTEEP